MSARSLLDPAFPDDVATALQLGGIEPGRLELKLTESAIMADPERAAAGRRRLAAVGVKLSLDDFGTGDPTLSRLRDLDFDEIKIDRSFAAQVPDNERDLAIMRTAIELGHNLGCSVVAEGLESARALAWVTAVGCDTAQGFHIARPQSAAALTNWLAERDAGQHRQAVASDPLLAESPLSATAWHRLPACARVCEARQAGRQEPEHRYHRLLAVEPRAGGKQRQRANFVRVTVTTHTRASLSPRIKR